MSIFIFINSTDRVEMKTVNDKDVDSMLKEALQYTPSLLVRDIVDYKRKWLLGKTVGEMKYYVYYDVDINRPPYQAEQVFTKGLNKTEIVLYLQGIIDADIVRKVYSNEQPTYTRQQVLDLLEDMFERHTMVDNYLNNENNPYFLDDILKVSEEALFGKNLVPVPQISDNWHIADKKMPDYDGEYLCLVIIKNECGTYSQRQKVLVCSMNEFITNEENEKVHLWRKLPELPKNKMKLIEFNN